MGDGDDEEAVGVVGDTGEGVVPGGEGGEQAEEAAGLDDGRVGLALGVAVDVADTEQQEGQVEEEEEQEEGHGGAQGAEEQDRGEDEPALDKLVSGKREVSGGGGAYEEEQAEGVIEHGGAAGFFDGRGNLESTGGQDDGKGQPEAAVRGQGGGTKGVADGHFPVIH